MKNDNSFKNLIEFINYQYNEYLEQEKDIKNDFDLQKEKKDYFRDLNFQEEMDKVFRNNIDYKIFDDEF